MKASLIFTTLCIAASGSVLFAAGSKGTDKAAAISVSDTREAYVFSAKYDRAETGTVERFINRQISPNRMGSSENDQIDAWTTLTDHTKFHIKESAGSLEISIQKADNPAASVARIKTLCDGVKQLLAKK